MVKAWRALSLVTAVAGATLFVLPAPAHADGIRDDQWHLTALKVAEAQQRTRGSGVVVAVVDTGVDGTHPDLSGVIAEPAVVDGTTGGAQGDPNGRGTALAGVIVGQGHGANRTNGVLGIAPDARVLPVVVRPPAGSQPTATVDAELLARGIELAVQRGATVICVGYSVESNERLRAAVETARKADAVVVAADGNRPGETFAPFPAAYDGVVAAVPLTRDGQVAVTSTSGRRRGVAVPGQEIMTTNSGGGYRIDGGMAAAGVLAGSVALVRAAYPTLPADEIVHRLTSTAKDGGTTGADAEFGAGSLDLVGSLTLAVPLLRQPAPSLAPTPSRAAPAPSSASPSAPSAAAAPRPRGPLGWLVAVPLVVVLAAMVGYAVRGERRIPAVRP